MKHAILAAAAAALLASTAPAVASSLDQIAGASVRLNGNCSGTIIHSDRDEVSGKVKTIVLTAKHCVKGSKPGETHRIELIEVDDQLREIGSRYYTADVIGQSTASDLAVLKLRDDNTYFGHVDVAPAEPKVKFGEPILTLGYPAGMSLTLTTGMLGYRDRVGIGGENEVSYQRATADVNPGSSGGALYHLKPGKTDDYELLGVTAAMRTGVPYFAFYVPADLINEYVKVAVPEVLK